MIPNKDIAVVFVLFYAHTVRALLRRTIRSVNSCFLALLLLVVSVFSANYHNFAVTLNYLTLIAHGLYGCSNFHNKTPLIFVSVNDTTLRNVIGRHLDFYRVTDKYLDVMHSNLTRNSTSYDMTVC